jgi:hypothetical protein
MPNPPYKRTRFARRLIFTSRLKMRAIGQCNFYFLLLFALASEVTHAANKCVEGIYSSIGEAKESGDLYGTSLIIVDQSRELNIRSKSTGKQRRASRARGIYSCTDNNDASSDLVNIEVSYPNFSFAMDVTQRCITDSQRSTDTSGVVTFTGEFTDKGIWLKSKEKKEFLPKTKNYCNISNAGR